MTKLAAGAIVACAGAGVGLLLASTLASVVWHHAAARISVLHPRTRAQLLAALRLGPAAIAIAAAIFVFIAFLRFEPASARDLAGVVLTALATVTLTVFVSHTRRALTAWRDTERTLARWTTDGDGFPTVAVVGIWRPRLYIAPEIADRCDRDELDAMIAHENAHIRAGDNLTRLLFLCAPYLPARTAHAIERAWTAASEEAADDVARRDEASALALASALTKVARLAIDRAIPTLHASAILSGSAIEQRVHRLLGTAPRRPPRDLRAVLAVMVLMIGVAGLSSPAQRLLYEAAEFCIRHLA